MNGSNINYAQHMHLCAERLARVLFSRIAVSLMDEESYNTLDLLDSLEDEILESSKNPTPHRLVEMRDALTNRYRTEFGTESKLSTIQLIASIPARFANAEAAQQRKYI